MNKMKKPTIDGEKILATHVYKGCAIRVFKDLLPINNKKADISIKLGQ